MIGKLVGLIQPKVILLVLDDRENPIKRKALDLSFSRNIPKEKNRADKSNNGWE
jgi:hypothetical protein